MFKVRQTILSDDIATAKFSCDVSQCRGACCVVGNAGAPVDKSEIAILKRAYQLLQDELRERAQEVVEDEGLIKGNNEDGYELSCTDDEECVFVIYDDRDIAQCAIQKAYYEGRIDWEKPLSCHLYPIRLKRILDFEYANFEYIPTLCAAGCEKGEKEGVYLSDFLKKPLIRRYGEQWYDKFKTACKEIRNK